MKKILLTILMVLMLGTVSAQHNQYEYAFGTVQITGATNLMASEILSYPLECKSFGVTAQLEYICFFTDALGARARGAIGFMPNTGEYSPIVFSGGLGLIVSTMDNRPYGFVEFRPRFDVTPSTLAYSRTGTRAFVTTTIGFGYNYIINNSLWLMIEGGIAQDFTYYNTYAWNNRDEVSAFLSIGVRYLINYESNN